MTPEELQIGDIITYLDGTICKVREIRNDTISVSWIDKDSKDWYTSPMSATLFNPIELTPEIMVKNGLENLYTDYYDLDVYEANDGLWRVVYSNLECSGFDESVLVSSVHEMQHFLRHLKIDKEIEI